MTSEPRIDVHLGPDDLLAALREDLRTGLTSVPKDLPPKWFYDERGSALFDEITRLPEYYPFRREREILDRRAGAIAAFGADTLVELGSGTSEKTRLLLDAMDEAGRLRRYVPFDVSEAVLRTSATEVASEYSGLEVHAVVGDFDHHIQEIPSGGRRFVAFLGGTIGNFDTDGRKSFLSALTATLEVGDGLLLGTDLVKDRQRLLDAYDDDAGVTANFNKNVLLVVNRLLSADFDTDRFRHRSVWVTDEEWIEMRLVSTCDQRVEISGLSLHVPFAEGEEMRTEISAKFRREGVEEELAAAGLELVSWWTDSAGDFALSLSRLT